MKNVHSDLAKMGTSPSNDNMPFRWVAEWQPHAATWIAWPHNLNTWPNRFDCIPGTFERLIRILADVETVHVLGGPLNAFQIAVELFEANPKIQVHDVVTDDCWIRDFGPTFVLNQDGSELAGVDWNFNAWGGKYPPFDNDAANAERICKIANCKRMASRLTCEGGALETDGNGTLLTTSRCLLSMSRNPDWTRSQVEEELKTQLGIRKVLWVDGGELAGDDTDSHIDQLVRFVRPGLLAAAVSYTTDDENAAKLERQFDNLSSMRDADDARLEIVRLVTPPPRFIQGERVPESYCNFYIANGIVIVPTFGFRETDEAAIQTLRELMPDRTVVPLDSSDLVWGRGAIHCVTQQQPAIAPSALEC
ncbi:MAG: agmatine deiminase family protein [Pirellulaceae bacterium]|nr:agmatine deiminase family protein [Pirellulaceae bacterium]